MVQHRLHDLDVRSGLDGHDKTSRDGLELLLRRMRLEPVILGNLPAEGDTIIGKLEKYLRDSKNVGFVWLGTVAGTV
ncbi:hypothetical protein CGZ93_06260 [Enemella dayhoffiae]|uniref:Uncharacterized protein n=1 Tax=Enemella dayhoffiae TaxID=2016507 RepID=A0A255H749_9ACTN|nr:hypothetical protein CGZ93_06260 [Enemella dayhoffiae]